MSNFRKTILALCAICLPLTSSMAEEIWRMDDFSYCAGDWKYAGCTSAGLHIDVGVWPVTPGHDVFVVYSYDGWQTWEIASAYWIENADNGDGGQNERWGADIHLGYTSMGNSLLAVDYAVFVSNEDGEIVWDNNDGANYNFPGGTEIDIW
jgi:hypothetical protein